MATSRNRGELSLVYLVTVDAQGNLVRLEMVPTRMRGFRITRASPDEAEWLAATLARSGSELGTSVAIADGRVQLRW